MRGVALAVALLTAVAAPAAADTRRGIDVSRFQGEIDWTRVAGSGIGFAYVQASRGSGRDCAVAPTRCGLDEQYARNALGARANGILVGAYHRAFTGGRTLRQVRRDARAEALVFTSTVGSVMPGDLRPALDLERPFGGLRPRALRVWTRVWLRDVEQALGVKPIIYTNDSSWQATGHARGFARRGHDLWVAQWNIPSTAIRVPAGGWDGQGWSIWQYSSTGRVRGIRGHVDLNRRQAPLERLALAWPAGAPDPVVAAPAGGS
jgi:lysozyme